MKKKKSTHKKRAKDRKKSAVVVRGSDRVVFDKLDKIFAKLLILMGAFQAISLKLAHVRVFQHFFEVRYFDRFAGVGVMLIIIGLIVLLRKWVTRNVMRLLSVLLTVALIIQVYVIFDLHYHLSLINKIEIERGENSITIMAITITIIIFMLHTIVLIFAVMDLIFNCKDDAKEAVLIFFKEKKDKKDE